MRAMVTVAGRDPSVMAYEYRPSEKREKNSWQSHGKFLVDP
jgi:hypothetical protein